MITYTTPNEYLTAREKLNAYNSAAQQYMADHKTNGIPAIITATFPYTDEVNNDMRSAIETYEFTSNPPDKYFLYIDETKNIATTWTGQPLGVIRLGRAYKCNMGDTRQSVTVIGINGYTYYGTYYKSSGNYARIKKQKNTSK